MADDINVPAEWINIIIGSVLASALSNIYGNTLWRLIISEESPISSVGWLILGGIIGGVTILALPPVRITTNIQRSQINIDNMTRLLKDITFVIPITMGIYGLSLTISYTLVETVLIGDLDNSFSIDDMVGLILLASGFILLSVMSVKHKSIRLAVFFSGIPLTCWLLFQVVSTIWDVNPVGGFGTTGLLLILIVPFVTGFILNRLTGYTVFEEL